MNKFSKKKLSLLIKIIVLLGTVTALYFLVDFKNVGRQLLTIPFWAIAISLIICTLRTWLTSIRWKTLNPNSNNQISNWKYFSSMMASLTYNLFMPGALGGDVARSIIIYKSIEKKRASNMMSIFVDRIVGFVSIILLGIIGCLFSLDLPGLSQYILILLACLTALVFLTLFSLSKKLIVAVENLLSPFGNFGKKIVFLLNTWHEMLLFYKKYPSRVIKELLLCVPIHFLWFIVMYILANINGIEISFFTIVIVTSLVWIITAIPITFSGMGVRELSFVYLLSLQGISSDAATTLSLHQFTITVLMAIIGIPFIWLANAKTKSNEKNLF